MAFKIQPSALPVPTKIKADPKWAVAMQKLCDKIDSSVCQVGLAMIEVGQLLADRHAEIEISNGEVAEWNRYRDKKVYPEKMERTNWEDYLVKHFPKSKRTASRYMRLARQWELLESMASNDEDAAQLIADVKAGTADDDWMSKLPPLPKMLTSDPDDFLKRLDQVTKTLAGTSLDGDHRIEQRKELAKLKDLNKLGEADAQREFENQLAKVEWLLKPEDDGGEGFTIDNLPTIRAALKIPKKLRKRLKPLKAGSTDSEIVALARLKDPPPPKPGESAKEPEDIEPIIEQLERGAVSVKEARILLHGGGSARVLECDEYARAYVDGAKVRIDLAVSKALEFRRVVDELREWCESITEDPEQPGGVCGSLYNDSRTQVATLDSFVEGLKKLVPWEFCHDCNGGGEDRGKTCPNCGGTGWLNFGMAQAGVTV